MQGLGALIAQHKAELLRFLTARCGMADEAEDVLQDLWLKATAQPATPIANPRAYLFRMANNLVLDRRRAQGRAMRRDRAWIDEAAGSTFAPEDRPDPAPAADDEIVRQQESEMLARAIAALPAGAQRALRLHSFDGHSQGEVAEIMGISRSGVEKHLALAIRHLRNALADCGFYPAAASHKQQPKGGNLAPAETER